MVNLAGTPGVTTSITPLGSIPSNTVKGIICVQGETKRGEQGKNYLVGTWSDFLRQLGGLHDESDFPLQCKQALESGAKLRVSRAFHYGNIDDSSTVEGLVAVGNIENNAVEPIAASAIAKMATWDGLGANFKVDVQYVNNPANGLVRIVDYNGLNGETIADALTAITTLINNGTATHKYSAEFDGVDTLKVLAPIEYGNLANRFKVDFIITNGTLSQSDTEFSNGVYVGGARIGFGLSSWNGAGSTLKITVPNMNGSGNITLIDYIGVNGEVASDVLVNVKTFIDTNITDYKALLNRSGLGIYIIKASLGAGGNGDMATVTITGGTISDAELKFANGVTAYPDLSIEFIAKSIGEGYNGTKIEIKPSTNNKADYCDIIIQLPDSPLPQEIKGVKRVLSNAELISLNKQMEGVEVNVITNNTLPLGTATLDGGEQDVSLITDTDYTGSSVSKAGWHAFDDVVDSMRVFNIARPTHDAALGLMLYLIGRKDMRGRTYTPKGLTIQGINDFREGTGSYSHAPLDSYLLDLWVANLEITDPNNLQVKDYEINGGGFQCGNRSIADNAKGEWYSDSGNDFGKIKGANGVPLNFLSPGNKLQYDVLYERGVNAIGNHVSFKVVNWGTRTTLLDTTNLLSKANIADLVVYISREVKKIAELMNFKPNDITMFNELYRRVLPFIKDTLVSGRAIEGDSSPTRGEGIWWHWLGDQNAKNLNDLKINVKSEVDAGKYRVRFAFKPIAANEYIGLDIAPADSVTILNVAQISNLNA